MDLNNLSIFVAVVDAGSLTKAAQNLGIPKSKVSRRLAQLEQENNASLILRSTRKLELTELGRDLYERCQPLLVELEAAQQNIASHKQQPKGELRIRIPPDFFGYSFTVICTEFLRQYPHIKLSFDHNHSEPSQQAYEADIIFVLHHGPLADSDLNAKPLMSLQQALYGATYIYKPDHLLKHDLKRENCILNSGENTWHFINKRHLQAVRVDGRLQLPSQSLIIDACISGMGIAKLTQSDAEVHVRSGVLTRLNTALPVEALSLTLLFRYKYLPVKARIFIDFFQKNIGNIISHVK